MTIEFVGPTNTVLGTATNDSAPAGYVGEFVSSQVLQGSAVSLSTGVAANVTSISLTAGDWDVRGVIGFIPGATTNITSVAGGVSSTSATNQSIANGGAQQQFGSSGLVPTANSLTLTPLVTRFSLASTTTIFLVANAGFTVSTLGAFGLITARRVR